MNKRKLLYLLAYLGIIVSNSSCSKKSDDNDCPVCPVVTSLSPAHGHKGDTITINGNNFGSNAINDIVRINGMVVDASDMISATSTQIRVIVPARCGTGAVTVAIDADLYSDGGPLFTYDFIQVVSVYAGQEGVVGNPSSPVPLTDPQFNEPDKILFDKAGIMYVLDANKTRIKKFDPSINMFREITPPGGFNIPDMTLDNNNNLYFAIQSSVTPTYYTLYHCIAGTYNTNSFRFVDVNSFGVNIISLAVDNNQNLYAAVTDNFGDGSSLLRIRPQLPLGNDSIVFGSPLMYATCPVSNDLYIYCNNWIGIGYTHSLLRLNMTTYATDTIVTTINSNGVNANRMTMKGLVPYVYDGNNVFFVNSTGMLAVYAIPPQGFIGGMAFDQAGDFYLAVNNCIKKISLE